MIGEEIGFEGHIKFDKSKPDGQHEKPSSNKKLQSLGWKDEYTPLREGLKETIKLFQSRYPNVRGVMI
jgi:nucleoside-diphosphate-sugar epimerase